MLCLPWFALVTCRIACLVPSIFPSTGFLWPFLFWLISPSVHLYSFYIQCWKVHVYPHYCYLTSITLHLSISLFLIVIVVSYSHMSHVLIYGRGKCMQGEFGLAAIRYCANHKGTTTAGAHLGHELISYVALPPTLANSLSLLDCTVLFFFPLSLSVCACVCLCVPAGVCHVWTVPSGATGANTATCAPMTPPAVPSRRDGSTLLRLVEHTCTDTRTYNLIHLFLSLFHPSFCIFALGFFLPASCTAFQLCVSLGACLQKDSHLSFSISEVVLLIQSSYSLQ